MHQPDDKGLLEKQGSRRDNAGKTFLPIAIFCEQYATKRDCPVYQVRDLHYITPCSRLRG